MLQKTLLNIEGLGRQLYPELDLWSTAKPYLEKWMKQRAGIGGLWESLKRQAPELSHQLPELPVLAHQALSRMEHEHRQRHQQVNSISTVQQQLTRQHKRHYRLRIGLILLAIALAWQPLSSWASAQEWPVLAAAGVGLLLLLWQ